MYRNSEQHFAATPGLHQKRSLFDLSTNHKTTLNVGDIVPLYVNTDIIPGDTFSVSESMVLRMQVPIYPTMDNIWIDTYWFFTPHRLVWQHWEEFMGANKTGAWEQTTEYTIPITKTGANKITKGDMLDYFGIQTDATNIWIDSLAQRAYIKIYNDWFRNQNLIAPLTETTGDSDTTYSHGTITTGGGLCKAAKVSSYWTTCLPAPQKGEATTLPLGDMAPIYGNGNPLLWQITEITGADDAAKTASALNAYGYTKVTGTNNINPTKAANSTDRPKIGDSMSTLYPGASLWSDKAMGLPTKDDFLKYASTQFKDNGTGLYADLSTATASTINALRLAFQTQKILERDARGGTRYAEILLMHFGVTNPMFNVLQMPEYLGGGRTPINIIQTTSTANTSDAPLGQPGATSITGNTKKSFTKSFSEHGTLMCVGVIRYSHSYQQKIHRMWRRQRRLDFYWPELQHIGEQPVYNYEIYAQGDSVTSDGKIVDNQVFGYQERYGELRFGDDLITGELRSTYSTPLDTWHYGDHYTSLPVLSQNWIEEDKNPVLRTLAVQTQDMFLGDFFFKIDAYRPIGLYGTPELLDHF